MIYRVFDTGINKLFGAFDSEEEAATLVRALLSGNDGDFREDLALGREADDGSLLEPISGPALVVWAGEVLVGQGHADARQRQPARTPGDAGDSGSGDIAAMAAAGNRR